VIWEDGEQAVSTTQTLPLQRAWSPQPHAGGGRREQEEAHAVNSRTTGESSTAVRGGLAFCFRNVSSRRNICSRLDCVPPVPSGTLDYHPPVFCRCSKSKDDKCLKLISWSDDASIGRRFYAYRYRGVSFFIFVFSYLMVRFI
jgi:hypothetical protein